MEMEDLVSYGERGCCPNITMVNVMMEGIDGGINARSKAQVLL